MFLTVHSAAGILIGQSVANPILSFILGIISHYILDIIPHGDTSIAPKYKNPIYIVTAGLGDLVILFFYLVFLLIAGVNLFKLSILTAIIGSQLPDILQAFYYMYRGHLFTKLQLVHNFFHDTIIADKLEWKFVTGLIFQFVVLVIFTIFIL